MAKTNTARNHLSRIAREPVAADELSNPELNPLLNPVLEENMGRWAQVYLTSPPEKRPQAVADLLLELREQDRQRRAHEEVGIASRINLETAAMRSIPEVLASNLPVAIDRHSEISGTRGALSTSISAVQIPPSPVRSALAVTTLERLRMEALRVVDALPRRALGSKFALAGLILVAIGSGAYRAWRYPATPVVARAQRAVPWTAASPVASPADRMSVDPNKGGLGEGTVARAPIGAVSPSRSAAIASRTSQRGVDLKRKVLEPAIPLPRLLVAERPEGRLVYPVSPRATLAGTVNLNVLIGTDGRIKQASILSGNRQLGVAAVRAVRLWRYRGHQLNGQPAEAETEVSISYFGGDAVSIKFLPGGSLGLAQPPRGQ